MSLLGPARIRRYLRYLAFGWTVFVALLFLWNLWDIRQDSIRLAETNARANFDKDQAFRHWATRHGGAYVPVTDHTPPNPHLAHIPERDLETPSGRRLTLMNPAYMVRQLNEDFAGWFGARGHITSLKLLRPENVPDPWEVKALQAFEHGVAEVTELTEIEGEPHVRLMRPMLMEEGCMKCHAHQGYEVGDIRGGVSVTVPMADYFTSERHRMLIDALSLGLLWLVGLAGLGVGGWRLVRYEDELRGSEQKFHSIFNDALDMIHICTADGRILDANRTELVTLGYSLDEYKGKRPLDLVHPDHREQVREAFAAVAAGERVNGLVVTLLTRAGEKRYIEMNIVPEIIAGKVVRIRAISRDITARTEAEEALLRLNRYLTTLSNGNVALVRARNEQELLDAICSVMIEDGGYRLVWVGATDENSGSGLVVRSAAGDRSYLEEDPQTWREMDTGQSPVARALREHEAVVLHDLAAESTPWREQALRHGFHSVAALPLQEGGELFGAITLYSTDPNAFDEAELGLLKELAGDLAYGIQVIRTRQQRDQAQGALGTVLVETVDAISRTVETRDPYTAGHEHRVAELAVAIARKMHIDEFRIEGLRLGGLLHDLGKIAVPAEILNRPGQLTDIEFNLIKQHPQSGYNIIKDVSFPWPVKEMVLQHHERLDGSGYPSGLQGNQIILEARILAVADVVEAITSHRPYRPGLGIDLALKEIRSGRGTIFCEEVVDACLAIFEEGFPGW